MKIGDKVLFKISKIDLCIVNVGSGEAVGTIKDFDGDFIIIKTGTGEHYINKNDIVRVLK